MTPDKCGYELSLFQKLDHGIRAIFTIYEGEVSTLDEMDVNGDIIPITRYRRSGIVERFDKSWDKPFNENAFHAHAKNLLKEVPNRTPIDEQA